MARIDAILVALVEEVLQAGGDGKDGATNTAALSHDELEAVIAYVDMDQSGEVDAKVRVAINRYGCC